MAAILNQCFKCKQTEEHAPALGQYYPKETSGVESKFLFRSSRRDAEAWPRRRRLRTFPFLSSDSRQRPGGTSVHDRPTKTGSD